MRNIGFLIASRPSSTGDPPTDGRTAGCERGRLERPGHAGTCGCVAALFPPAFDRVSATVFQATQATLAHLGAYAVWCPRRTSHHRRCTAVPDPDGRAPEADGSPDCRRSAGGARQLAG